MSAVATRWPPVVGQLQQSLEAAPHQPVRWQDPAIPASTRAWLQERLQAITLRPSAVLVALLKRDAGIHVLLTQRSKDMPHHPGQVSFPGGRCNAEDADARATALREAEEETAMLPATVHCLGYLPDMPTLTGFNITPVVGWVEAPAPLLADPREVEQLIELPLQVLQGDNPFTLRELFRHGKMLPYYELNWNGLGIWGATANILHQLHLRLTQSP